MDTESQGNFIAAQLVAPPLFTMNPLQTIKNVQYCKYNLRLSADAPKYMVVILLDSL